MNKKSKICQYISEHENWQDELLKCYGIATKVEGPYAIFNYSIDSNFKDPLVQEARGIIVNTETLDVACWPFRKFGNYGEPYADTIDWSTARVQDKIDGSIIKMWYNAASNYKNGEGWVFSTNAVIDAGKSLANATTRESFLDVVQRADNFKELVKEQKHLDKNCTYIFELVSPETQVVVRYDKCHLYHIGTRCNIDGVELDASIGIEKPKEYPIRSLDECIKAAAALNLSEDGQVHKVAKEGYVVVDGNFNRIKVKSPDYLMMHHMASQSNFSKERIVEMLRSNSMSVGDMCKEFPNFAHYFKYYDFAISELEYQASIFCDFTKRLYEEYHGNRKAVAMAIKDHRLASVGFAFLDGGTLSCKDILSKMSLKRYCKFIGDYKPEKLSDFFVVSARSDHKEEEESPLGCSEEESYEM